MKKFNNINEQLNRMKQLMGIENPDEEDFIFLEGLIRTVPPEDAKRLLERFFTSISKEKNDKILGKITSQTVSNIQITSDDSLMIDLLPLESNIENIRYLLKYINNLGYIIGSIFMKEKSDEEENRYKYDENILFSLVSQHESLEQFDIEIEAKFDIERNEIGIPKKLYHITLQRKLLKILKQGLVPKSESKLSTHPERIYFGIKESNVNALIPHYRNYYNSKGQSGMVMAILEIDTTKVKDLKLYDDPNYKHMGYYTLVNVPSDAIKVIRENIRIN